MESVVETQRHEIEALTQERLALLQEIERLKAQLSGQQSSKPASEDSVEGISTVAAEAQFWARVNADAAQPERQRRRAGLVLEKLQPLVDDFQNQLTVKKSVSEVLDMVDVAQDSLDALWRCEAQYPQNRMANLLGVLGAALARYFEAKYSTFDLFHEPYAKIREVLRVGLLSIDKWLEAVERLTAQVWPGAERPWTGPAFRDPVLPAVRRRVSEVLEVRAVHDQLARLLPGDSAEELARPLTAFAGVRAMSTGEALQSVWESARQEYERHMAPLEARVAARLRSHLSSMGTGQLQFEFQRFEELMARPGMRRALVPEREALLGALRDQLARLRSDFEARSQAAGAVLRRQQSEPLGTKNLPEIVMNIVWARQLASKVAQMDRAARGVLADLPMQRDFAAQLADALQDIRAFERDQFREWRTEVEGLLQDASSPLAMQMTGRLMELDMRDGRLKVFYSERLVQLLREVRQLTALGLAVPRPIRQCADDAQRFYRHAVVLKQVANFYNTITAQIIPSQKPMMLGLAMDFEEAVKKPHGRKGASVEWRDVAEVETFVATLQQKENQITAVNRKLRKYHAMLGERVQELMNEDLLRNTERWRRGVAEMREMIDGLESQGFSDTRLWRTHWDYQLYKALEHQYQRGLESLNENLPEIRVELVFKNRTLQFRPPLEQIRAQYYREMRKFIALPLSFTGVGDSEVFKLMPDRNGRSLLTVYRKAEALLAKLEQLPTTLKDWVALGMVNIEEYVEANVREAADWEANFRMIKLRGKEVEKLPHQYKVDCVTVSAAPFKAAIDDQMQRFADALVASLERAVKRSATVVDSFLTAAQQAFDAKPQSIEEIGKASSAYKDLARQRDDIKRSLDDCEGKNRLLRSIVGHEVDLSAIRQRWEHFEVALEASEEMIRDQRESLKSSVRDKVRGFEREVAKFAARWAELKPKSGGPQTTEAAQAASAVVKEYKAEVAEVQAQADKLKQECVYFEVDVPDFAQLQDTAVDIERTEQAWQLFDAFLQERDKLSSEEWITFRSRMHLFEDFVQGWGERLRKRAQDDIGLLITALVDQYRRILPLLKFVRGDSFTEDDHWPKLLSLLEMPRGLKLKDLTLAHFLDSRASALLVQHQEKVKTLHARANGEVVIRKALTELAYWGNSAVFTLTDRKGDDGVALIREWKEIMTQVSDNQALIGSLKDSPYFDAFRDRAADWEQKLGVLAEALALLNVVQRKWVYLQPIFARGALPSEQPRFKKVDSEFRSILDGVQSDPRLLSLATVPDIKNTLEFLVKQLEHCQKALSEYLEEKRAKFPRFYFIGDDDLLEILGQAQNPAVIRSHLKKLFQGIHDVAFSGDTRAIVAMRSIDGEEVPLARPVAITDVIESWLSALAVEMQNTLAGLLVQSLSESSVDLNKYPSQVICLSQQILFTQRCEAAIQRRALPALQQQLRDELATYTALDVGQSHLLRLKVQALVLDVIHNLDVVDQLVQAGTASLSDYMWTKQLRFYMDADTKRCFARMCDARFAYTYEYQGNAPKLVHTPLTDKCYLTLTLGMHMGYGGNPYGPAGTGKTESVKALANALGRQVLVFNCDEGIDFKSMGRIFIGLVKCGAWGCFDEFNRLEEEVLSAVSQQIQVIQTSIKQGERSFRLLDKEVDVNPNAGIFVTLNPAGKGYGGRSKLPDNLKQLFRPVVMTAPDNELIAEVMLYSVGFQHAKELARKTVSLFQLCRQLLSAQQHYDWGLRALKTILGIAGLQILEEKRRTGMALSVETERELMVKSLRVNTLSKLTHADSLVFSALLSDVFAGVPAADIHYGDLQDSIQQAVLAEGLVVIDAQVKKTLQFYEALRQRMGVMIVGPSGCGKSALWRALQGAYKLRGQRLVVHTINPKAMPRQQLLGHMDIDTREWFDGVLTAAARQVTREPADTHSWIVCDGDIDPEWVESLNSVLDDNRLLTLPNGERIQFGNNVNFVFETSDLRFASPATVSRMGMILMSEEDMDAAAMVKSWRAQHQEQYWSDDLFVQAYKLCMKAKGTAVPTTRGGTIASALSQLAHCSTKTEFVLGLIRGFGANMPVDVRTTFADAVFKLAGEVPPDPSRPLDCDVVSGSLRAFKFTPARLSRQDVLGHPMVHTINVQRHMAQLLPWLQAAQPVLLVGPEGCGKSMLLRACFEQMKGISVATVHCAAQTTAKHVRQKLAQVCGMFNTSSGRVLRPKEGDRLVLYLKDINLPAPDKYDTMQLAAFLQQLISYRGFYDESLEWIGVERVQIVATMNPASTLGRHQLSTRLTAIMRIYYMDYPDLEQLKAVYSAYADAVLRETCPRAPAAALAAAMLGVYELVRKHFTADSRPHYLFTPRDLTQWILGLLRYDLSEDNLLDVWVYEAQRIFRDRLVGERAQSTFDKIVAKALSDNRLPMPAASSAVYATQGNEMSVSGQPLLAPVPLPQFAQRVAEALKSYEREVRELNLQLFPEMLTLVARVDRALSQSGGSLLLVGRTGIGRRSAVSLVCHANRMKLVTPRFTQDYTPKAFGAELKEVLRVAGAEGAPIVLLLEEHMLGNPAFLELINSLLSAGEVPGLFTQEELDQMLGGLTETMTEQGFFGTLFDFFVSRVRRNLRIVLNLDASSPAFVERMERNPALQTRCALVWWDSWSEAAMREVAVARLQPVLAPAPADALVSAVLAVHNAREGATPRDFLAFVENYRRVFEAKRASVREQSGHLESGLAKLQEAARTVDELSRAAAAQQRELDQKQREAEEALNQIQAAMEKAGERKKEMEILQRRLAKEEQEMAVAKDRAEGELSQVQPILDEARAAVGNINPRTLSELRTMSVPPQVIRDILEAVLRLLGVADTTWESMRRFLAERTVTQRIMQFDVRTINQDTFQKVCAHVEKFASSFTDERAEHASAAALPMCKWVKANLRYYEVADKVAPLAEQVARLTQSLEQSQARVLKSQQVLVQLDQQVAELRANFGKRTAEAEALKISLAKAQEVVQSASSLLGKLSGERGRWEQQTRELRAELDTLPLSSLLAAASITYLGTASEDARAACIRQWMEQFKTPAFQLLRFLSTESEQLQWKAQGLPADGLFMENAAMLQYNTRTPLVVDPSAQAAAWLLKKLGEGQGTVEQITPQDARFTKQLELAVRFGKTLVISEVDSVDPVLVPLLRRDLLREGPRFVVTIGDRMVDYHENFKLFLVTRSAQPTIPSDVVAHIAQLNFTVTRSGLEAQLLGLTLQHEQPELERQKSALLHEEETNKLEMAALEKALLGELSASQGAILENKQLVASLEMTKDKSNVIAGKLAEGRRLQEALDQQREVYRPVARAAATMFFVVRDLAKASNMYQFALPMFVRLFDRALNARDDSHDVESRIKSLVDQLLRLVLSTVSRALFKADRLMFAMHFAHCMRPDAFAEGEWELFVGQVAFDPTSAAAAAVSLPDWVPPERADPLRALAIVCPGLYAAMMAEDARTWSTWCSAPQCETDFPRRLDKAASAFQRVLVVQALRPDRLASAMHGFACATLGVSSLSPAAFSLQRLLEEDTRCDEPVLLITTPGADPTADVVELAGRTVGKGAFEQVAMGQGQQETALRLLRDAAQRGTWLLLKNLHLVTGWLPVLEKELNTLKPKPSFRLWLTAEPHPKFPPILLQSSLKVTFEAPPGLKRNLQRTYDMWTPADIAAGSSLRAQLLFALAWFHAVVQERRTYMPQGWTKFYEFSTGDLRAGADVLNAVCASGATPDWPTIHGLLESALYGGRVDNEFDTRVLRTYIQQFFNADVVTVPGGRPASRRLFRDGVLPTSTNHADYVKLISTLPSYDSPAMFGLPANIDRVVQRAQSTAVLAQLKQLAVPASLSTQFNREEWANQMKPVLKLWKQLTGENDVLKTRFEVAAEEAQPILAFIVREHQFAFGLLREVNSALAALADVLRGASLLTPAVLSVAQALLAGRVPDKWSDKWDAADDPYAWMRSLVARAQGVNQLVRRAQAGQLIGGTVTLGDLFHPDTFLNALRQHTARQLRCAMDELKLVTSWRAGGIAGAVAPVTVTQLLLQGCTMDSGALAEADAAAPELMRVPDFALAWLPHSAPEPYRPTEVMTLPLYMTAARSRVLAELKVPCGADRTPWILCGAAFVLRDE